MIINAMAATAAFTVNGTNAGLVTVADATPFWVGARVYIGSSTEDTLECTITSIPSNATLTVRRVDSEPYNYGNSDISAYHVADTASITMPPQTLQGPDETFLKFVNFWSGLA